MSKIEAKIEAVFQVYWKLLYTKAFTCKLDCSPQITVPDWVAQESFFREDSSVKMEPQNRKYPIILLLAKQNKPKGKISCITVPCIHLSCIHVSVLFVSTIGLVRKSRKLSRALLNLQSGLLVQNVGWIVTDVTKVSNLAQSFLCTCRLILKGVPVTNGPNYR